VAGREKGTAKGKGRRERGPFMEDNHQERKSENNLIFIFLPPKKSALLPLRHHCDRQFNA
jgi:hypothetical protein